MPARWITVIGVLAVASAVTWATLATSTPAQAQSPTPGIGAQAPAHPITTACLIAASTWGAGAVPRPVIGIRPHLVKPIGAAPAGAGALAGAGVGTLLALAPGIALALILGGPVTIGATDGAIAGAAIAGA